MNAEQEVSNLLQEAVSVGVDLPQGISSEEVALLSTRIGIEIPLYLRKWLMLCNGSHLGEGGTFGVTPHNKFLDIESHYIYSVTWKDKEWIPIAGDGCGNFYVVDTKVFLGSSNPIYFVDQENYEQPTYVVASGLWHFLYFYLGDNIDGYWPFEVERVLQNDPMIQECDTAPLPWEA